MKHHLALACAAALAAAPALAEEAGEPEGRSLMERGMQLFFEGLKDEMSPALRDLGALADEIGPPMQRFLSEMGPALAGILARVEDWTQYEAPEILPNGDIIIRRKPEAPPAPVAPEEKVKPGEPTDI
ncbi:hypothetical protein [Seohaeicola zhoushanensis]|nr:hypothetical protein [Seohaeicola zhoushanensis]